MSGNRDNCAASRGQTQLPRERRAGEVQGMRAVRRSRETCAHDRAVSGTRVRDQRPFTTSCKPAYASCMPVQGIRASPGSYGIHENRLFMRVCGHFRTRSDASRLTENHGVPSSNPGSANWKSAAKRGKRRNTGGDRGGGLGRDRHPRCQSGATSAGRSRDLAVDV
jgi:hypothetical protein